MQTYPYFPNQYIQQAPDSTVNLRPDQIKLKSTVKTTEQSKNAIIRLANSIKKYGILEPLEVVPAENPSHSQSYDLISGERRLRAALLAGIESIPCRILSPNDKSCVISSLLARIRSENLHFFEQAAAFRMLINDFELTQEEIARKSGLSQSAVANKLRLLTLSKEEQTAITAAGLTERHARAILRLKSPQERQEAIAHVRANNLKVAATEQLVDAMLAAQKDEQAVPKMPPEQPISVVLSPQHPPQGITPRKFALKDLTPLYNSIERTLSIFRKTGETVTCTREESREGVRIVIHIPGHN